MSKKLKVGVLGVGGIAQVHYPGWKASVDGRLIPIQNNREVFRRIVVPKGEHTVEFRFDSESFKNGCLISAVSLFFALILWIKKAAL